MSRFEFVRQMKYLVNKSIAARISIYFSVFGTLLLILLGIVNYYKSSNSLTSEVIYYTSKIINQSVTNLDYYFNDAKSSMILLATNSFVTNSMESYATMNWEDKLDNNRKIEELLSNINIFKPYIDDVIIVGKSGYVTNLSSGRYLNTNYQFLHKAWVKESLSKSSKTFNVISLHLRDYYYWPDQRFNTNTISVIMSVYNESNVFIGVIIFDMNIDKLGSLIKPQTIEEKGSIFLLDEKGLILFHPDKSIIGKNYSMEDVETFSRNKSGKYTKNNNEESLIIYNTSDATGWKIVADIPMKMIYKHSSVLKTTTYTSIIICIAMIVIISLMISLQIARPLKDLVARMKQVERGDFTTQKNVYGYGEVQILGEKFEEMVYKIDNLIVENYQSKLIQKEAQFQAFQTQINPHFLFNTIQLIQTEILCGSREDSSKILMDLSNLLRYSIEYHHEMVTLQEEVDYVTQYLNIYSKKYEGRLQIEACVDTFLENYRVPKLILQPLVENCILHAFKKGFSKGEIYIECIVLNKLVNISISDNGIGIEPQAMDRILGKINIRYDGEGSIGLRNVHQRIKMKYGEEYGLTVESRHGEYTKVTIILPLDEVKV